MAGKKTTKQNTSPRPGSGLPIHQNSSLDMRCPCTEGRQREFKEKGLRKEGSVVRAIKAVAVAVGEDEEF